MFPSPPQRTFRDSLTRRIAAGALFLALLAWGIYDRADSGEYDRLTWEAVVLAGLLFAVVMVIATGRRISIHPEGISYVSLFRHADLAWDEITSTRYQQQSIDVPVNFGWALVLFYLAAEKTGFMLPSLWITGGQTVRIGAGVRDGHAAIDLVLEKVDARLRPEAAHFLAAGATVTFGKISLSQAGVIWKKRAAIPWSEIGSCRLEGRRLRIRRQGKRYDSVVVLTRKVPNLFVLTELIQDRISALAGETAVGVSSQT